MSNLTALLNKYKALVIFDTETSGLDFDKDQIIELAALRVERTASGGLRIAGKMDTFIKLPEGETLPENIVSLTGITDALLQTEGVQPAKAASQIAKLMQPGPVLMIAHNAQFDACFLRGLLRGAKVGRIDWLDSLTVYKDRRPYPHKLAMTVALSNYPDIIQLGDAFDLRRDDWELGKRFDHEDASAAEPLQDDDQTTDLSSAPAEIKEAILKNDQALSLREADPPENCVDAEEQPKPRATTDCQCVTVVDILLDLRDERLRLSQINGKNRRYGDEVRALEYAIDILEAVT